MDSSVPTRPEAGTRAEGEVAAEIAAIGQLLADAESEVRNAVATIEDLRGRMSRIEERLRGGSVIPKEWAVAIEMSASPVRPVLETLAGTGLVAVPVIGYELGDEAWMVEVAWPEARGALVVDEDPERDRAYLAAGWRLWLAVGGRVPEASELIAELGGRDGHGRG